MDSNIQILNDAAVENRIGTLYELIEKDPKVLERASLSCGDKNPLHISAMFGNLEFVQQLISQCPEMCLAGDRLGRTPLHLAVIWGRSEVVEELVRANPLAARERMASAGGNVLHLCVRSNQLNTLKFVVRNFNNRDHIFSQKDDEGMTILHLAVLDKRIETIKFLLESKTVPVNAKNGNGKTALDLVLGASDKEIADVLEHAGAKLSASNPEWVSRKRDAIMVVAILIATMAFQVGINPPGGVWQDDKPANSKTHVAETAVMADPPAGMIANPPAGVMANAPMLNAPQGDVMENAPPAGVMENAPPGDVMADDKPKHDAGSAVMAYSDKNPNYYKFLVILNTTAFVSSLSTILLLISGLPFQNRPFMWISMGVMWVAITTIAATYAIAIKMVTPKEYVHDKELSHAILISVLVWAVLISLLLLWNILRFMNWWQQQRKNGVNLWKKVSGYISTWEIQNKKVNEKQAGLEINVMRSNSYPIV